MDAPYEAIGGDAGIRRLVDRFYDLMDTAPEARTIRTLHAKSLKASRDKLHMFLVGWTGGPPVYVQKFGHPRLRMRHVPFSIGARERDEWLWCMDHALDEQPWPGEIREFLRQKLHQLADFMRNREEDPTTASRAPGGAPEVDADRPPLPLVEPPDAQRAPRGMAGEDRQPDVDRVEGAEPLDRDADPERHDDL